MKFQLKMTFLIESLNNFKLLQMKKKAKKMKINDNNDNIIKMNSTKSNLLGLIQLDYGEENDENKENSNILEPIELDKSHLNMSIRKSFVDSFRRDSAMILPSVYQKDQEKRASLFK